MVQSEHPHHEARKLEFFFLFLRLIFPYFSHPPAPKCVRPHEVRRSKMAEKKGQRRMSWGEVILQLNCMTGELCRFSMIFRFSVWPGPSYFSQSREKPHSQWLFIQQEELNSAKARKQTGPLACFRHIFTTTAIKPQQESKKSTKSLKL